MNPVLGWGLAVVALVAGWLSYGWPGVVLALSVILFWLLLQFSRVLRVMRKAAERPIGSIDNAVMLHAKLQTGMKLLQILPLTRSLGVKVVDDPETFVWTDAGGDRVRVELRSGRCSVFALERAALAEATEATEGADPLPSP